MTIAELKPSARVRGRWLVVLDDGSLLRVGEQEVLSFALYAGRELTDEEADALLMGAGQTQRKEKAMALLARKPQSRRDLAQQLRLWGAEEEEIELLCARLEELGLLDDGAYARRLARHYTDRGYGPYKVREELRRRGVPREYWDDALEQEDDSTAKAVDDFLRRKLGAGETDRQELKKASDALARRGFSWDEIRAGLRRYGEEIEEE